MSLTFGTFFFFFWLEKENIQDTYYIWCILKGIQFGYYYYDNNNEQSIEFLFWLDLYFLENKVRKNEWKQLQTLTFSNQAKKLCASNKIFTNWTMNIRDSERERWKKEIIINVWWSAGKQWDNFSYANINKPNDDAYIIWKKVIIIIIIIQPKLTSAKMADASWTQGFNEYKEKWDPFGLHHHHHHGNHFQKKKFYPSKDLYVMMMMGKEATKQTSK